MNFGSYKEGKRRWDWVAQSCLFLVERSHTDYSLASLHVMTEGPHRSLHSINTRSFDSTISPGELAIKSAKECNSIALQKETLDRSPIFEQVILLFRLCWAHPRLI